LGPLSTRAGHRVSRSIDQGKDQLRPLTRSLRLLIAAALLTVASGAVAVVGATASSSSPPLGAFTTKGAYGYQSAPKLHPPKLAVDAPVNGGQLKQLSRGYFMLANFKDLTATKSNGSPAPMVGQSGPLILDNHLQPVWFHPVPQDVLANNLTTQTYNGKPALSWWQGVVTNTGAIVSGEDVVVNQQYKTVATLKGADGWTVALHEMLIRGTDAWVIASKTIPASDAGGPANVQLLDTAVQKYDLKTGKLLYTWDPATHIPLSDSYATAINGVWDAYHANSINFNRSGSFLVSMRNTWGAYLVNPATSAIEWKLGGKPLAGVTNFAVDSAGQFQWQHDVQFHAKGTVVSVFDDHCCAITGPGQFAKPTGPSRGLVLKLDAAKHTASLVSQFVRAKNFNSGFLGSTDLLPNGNTVIGWGSTPFFSEYNKAGKRLLDVTFPGPDLSYRAYVQSWTGKPSYPPALQVKTRGGKATVYASWNGDTQVASWRVLGGTNAAKLKTVAQAGKSGFETAIGLNTTYKLYKVVALDSKGHVLKRSDVWPPPKKKGSGSQPPPAY
jgi:hypothetical protein